jgi:hypothetical protein
MSKQEVKRTPPQWQYDYAEAMAIIDGRCANEPEVRHLIAMRIERLDHAYVARKRQGLDVSHFPAAYGEVEQYARAHGVTTGLARNETTEATQ